MWCDLSGVEREQLEVLLRADEGECRNGLIDREVAEWVGVVAVARWSKFANGVRARASRRHRSGTNVRGLDGEGEARLVSIACSEPPAGYARWTLRLLGDRLVELKVVESRSPETVRPRV